MSFQCYSQTNSEGRYVEYRKLNTLDARTDHRFYFIYFSILAVRD